MATITTEMVKELRDRTEVSIMQCRKALEEAGGDMEKAILILKKKSGAVADKKGGRTLGAGTVASYIHTNGQVGVMVELDCETDFVSGNEEFKKLAYDIAMHIAALNPEYIRADQITEDAKAKVREAFANEVEGKPEEMKAKILEGKMTAFFKDNILLDQPFVKNPEITIKGLIDAAVQKFGERMEVSRFTRFSTKGR